MRLERDHEGRERDYCHSDKNDGLECIGRKEQGERRYIAGKGTVERLQTIFHPNVTETLLLSPYSTHFQKSWNVFSTFYNLVIYSNRRHVAPIDMVAVHGTME